MSKEITIYESDEIKKTARMRGRMLLMTSYISDGKGGFVEDSFFNYTPSELELMLKVAKGEA